MDEENLSTSEDWSILDTRDRMARSPPTIASPSAGTKRDRLVSGSMTGSEQKTDTSWIDRYFISG